jgi:peroxiredoxin family protein
MTMSSDDSELPLSLILFSGTDDRLTAAAVLVAGAAALGRPVHIFLQYWALAAFRADRIEEKRPLAPEAGAEGQAAVDAMSAAGQSWRATLRMAKEIGEVDIQACSLTMDLLHIDATQLDPLVDGVQGVAAFFVNAGDGQLLFI